MGIPRVQNWVTYNFSILVDFCYLKPFAASSQVPRGWRTDTLQVAWLAFPSRCRSMPNVCHQYHSVSLSLSETHVIHMPSHPHLFFYTVLPEGTYIGTVRKNASLLGSARVSHKVGPREEASHAFYLAIALTINILGASSTAQPAKNLPAMQETQETGLTPGSGRSPGGERGNPVQYSCQENPMDRRA